MAKGKVFALTLSETEGFAVLRVLAQGNASAATVDSDKVTSSWVAKRLLRILEERRQPKG